MITNLFSIFDPSTSKIFRLNWLSLFIPLLLSLPLFWTTPSRPLIFTYIIFKNISKEININLKNQNLNSSLIFLVLFYFIIVNNLIGLYPYIFTATSHLTITLGLAFPLWFSLILWGWLKKTNNIFAHLVPLGTPLPLTFFIVLIESISLLIRPITLSVRLAANIIAGHLLLSLLSNIREKLPSANIFIYPLIQTLLSLEYAVAIIQSYVFIVLISLYLAEINYDIPPISYSKPQSLTPTNSPLNWLYNHRPSLFFNLRIWFLYKILRMTLY